METFTLRSYDGFPLSVAWFPVENPRACVQLIHGALEHKERYEPFIQFLNDHSCAAVIADNRGHGHSVTKAYPLGYMAGVAETMRDQELLTAFLKKQYPEIRSTLVLPYLDRKVDATK